MKFMDNAARALSKMSVSLKRNSPEIFIAVGILSGIASTVCACVSTVKATDVVAEANEDISKIREDIETKSLPEHVEQNSEAIAVLEKNIVKSELKCAGELVKLYAPSVIFAAVSITSILYGHKITKNRELAMAAANASMAKAFHDYRQNVIEKYGEEVDAEMNSKTTIKEETVVDPETGEEMVIQTKVKERNYSPYARVFDELNPNWNKDADVNLFFLKQQQLYATQRLRVRGYLFLNDVYDALGIPRTVAGNVVGWIYDPMGDDGKDNYVDFGLKRGVSQAMDNFLDGDERSCMLEFNVDGDILHNMKYFSEV